MPQHPGPILLTEGEPHIVALVRTALEQLHRGHPLMVVNQPAELRQYLAAARRANRYPVAILVQAKNPLAASFLTWFGNSEHEFPTIPIITLGGRADLAQFDRIEAAAEPLNTRTLVDAL